MTEKNRKKPTIEDIVSLSKRRGFVFQGSEIYGGLANTWDYGPYGSELKNNIRDAWWNFFVRRRRDMVGLDAAILMNSKVWEASGHVGGFSDPLIDCKNCKARHRADKLIEDFWAKRNEDGVADGWSAEKTKKYMTDEKIVCPDCGEVKWGDVKQFNLMFKTQKGVTDDSSSTVYLRPETAQGIFVDFKQTQSTSRKKIPFGVGQVGKAFRNEITPGNFIFRTLEFEQMEIEFFIKPGTEDEWQKKWEEEMWSFLWDALGASHKDDFRLRWHNEDELSHYSSGTFDFEYNFPFGGFGELWGCASRTDFDLSQHEKHSGVEQKYLDPATNEKYIPYVIEPTFGLTRTVLMILCDAYDEDILDGEKRVVLRFSPKIAPVKMAILPLMKKDGLGEKAKEICDDLALHFACEYDETGSIGKRYRRQDEIGTPWCATVDYETVEDEKSENFGTVTVRDRDSGEQQRVKIEDLRRFVEERL